MLAVVGAYLCGRPGVTGGEDNCPLVSGSGGCQVSNDENCSHCLSRKHFVQREGPGGADAVPVMWLSTRMLRVSLTR